MATVSLSANSRDLTGKGAARTLRSIGQVPAVIYGHGRDPQPLSLNARDLDKMLSHIQAESTVIEVTVTDTVRIPPEKRFSTLKVLSVGELLSKAIRYIHSEQSVSSLFEQ